jgi:hypothetical protein
MSHHHVDTAAHLSAILNPETEDEQIIGDLMSLIHAMTERTEASPNIKPMVVDLCLVLRRAITWLDYGRLDPSQVERYVVFHLQLNGYDRTGHPREVSSG